MEVSGNVALVTGAASGLGEATARRLHAHGASIVLADLSEERGQAISSELGPNTLFVRCDVTSESDVAAAVAAGAEMGRLAMSVHCAGGGIAARTVGRDGTPHDLDAFRRTIELNLIGTFNVLRLAAAQMATNDVDAGGERGVCVQTASIAGYEGQIGQIAYGSAKAGVIGMTIIAARDLAAIGVRVNSIAPGTMLTRAWEKAPAQLRTSLESKVPFPQRFGHPEEFASLCEHLITNRYVNGQVIRIDGAIRFDPK